MVCISASIARLAGHRDSRISGYTSSFFLPFFSTWLFSTEMHMIGAQQQDVHEEQNNEAVEPENDVEALLAGVDFQQPRMGMGEQQVDDYQEQQFADVNYDRGF